MAVKIRLKRFGKKRAPFYRVVVMDSRTKRDGRAIEEIGKYHPTQEPSVIEINSERVQYWLSVGAQPTEQVEVLLKLTGDWGLFKGDKNATNTVKPQVGKKSADDKIKAAADASEKLKAEKSAAIETAKKAAAAEAEVAAAAAAVAAAKAAAEAEVAAAAAIEAEVVEAEVVEAEVVEAEVEVVADAADQTEAVADDTVTDEIDVADESSEVPTDEGIDVDIEIAEGDPSDTDDAVEGLVDEAEEK